MNSRNKTLSQSEIEAQERREEREKKPVREWTAAERREAFREAREAERQRANAGIFNEWDLRGECHEYRRERGRFFCKHCIQLREYAD
jgi:hypothetical protein